MNASGARVAEGTATAPFDASVAGPSAAADLGDMWLTRAVRQGLTVQEVGDALTSGRLSAAGFDRLLLRKALSHRRTLGRFLPKKSERLVRLLRMTARAGGAFGSAAVAHLSCVCPRRRCRAMRRSVSRSGHARSRCSSAGLRTASPFESGMASLSRALCGPAGLGHTRQ